MKEWIAAAFPHLRALLVALHLVAIGIAAVPAPVGGMSRDAWKDPTVQAEFGAWARRLGMAPDALEARAWGFANAWMGARQVVMKPVTPYLALTGTEQPWRMFVAPHRFPARYEVDVGALPAPPAAPAPPGARAPADAAWGWQTLFEERSREFRWREAFFSHERVRSMLFRYAWPMFAPDAKRTCDYLARQVWASQPDATVVRCRYYKAASPSPEQAAAGVEPPGSYVQVHLLRRPLLAAPAAPPRPGAAEAR